LSYLRHRVDPVHIRIEGHDLPGRRAGAEADRLRLANVHVGVQGKAGVAGRFPATAASAGWDLDVASREVDGLLDVGGPWVHGRPGARFLYLSWGNVDDDERFTMFRRAKLLFGDIPTATLRAAHEGAGALVGSLGLTDAAGEPRCARVRPPDIVWALR
jgi:hypothetical protein